MDLRQQAERLLEQKARRVHDRRFSPSRVTDTFRSKIEPSIALERARRTAWLARTHFGSVDGVRLLDIGCGFGTFVLASLAEGLDARGVDMAEGEIEFAKDRLQFALGSSEASRFIRQRGENLPFENGAFDMVTLWMVLEHIPRWRDALREATRVLRPGGLLLVSAPNYLRTFREPHFGVAWNPCFTALPRSWIGWYVRRRGLGKEYFENELALVHVVPVGRFLRKLGLDVGYGHRMLLRTARRRTRDATSPSRVLRTAAAVHRWGETLRIQRLLEHLLGLWAWFPFRNGTTFYAHKPGVDPSH